MSTSRPSNLDNDAVEWLGQAVLKDETFDVVLFVNGSALIPTGDDEALPTKMRSHWNNYIIIDL